MGGEGEVAPRSGLPGAKEERKGEAGSKGKRGLPGHRTSGTWSSQGYHWLLWAGSSPSDQRFFLGTLPLPRGGGQIPL